MNFWTKLTQKGYFRSKQNENQHWVLHIRINLGSKLYLQQFWDMEQISKKGYFQSKTGQINITIKFFVFKLVFVPIFSSNWQFWFFGPNLPKKGISSIKQVKWTPPLILHIKISLCSKLHFEQTILDFGPKLPKMDIYG